MCTASIVAFAIPQYSVLQRSIFILAPVVPRLVFWDQMPALLNFGLPLQPLRKLFQTYL